MKYKFNGVCKFLDRVRAKLRGTDVLDAQNAAKACAAAKALLVEIATSNIDTDWEDRAIATLILFRGEA